LPVADAPGRDVCVLGPLLGTRRETGQLVQVGDDPGQHPEHSGAVERHGFRLGIGLGPQVHRELHWHPDADEWQYVIEGHLSVTMFGSQWIAGTPLNVLATDFSKPEPLFEKFPRERVFIAAEGALGQERKEVK
jgi:hypothetical protein